MAAVSARGFDLAPDASETTRGFMVADRPDQSGQVSRLSRPVSLRRRGIHGFRPRDRDEDARKKAIGVWTILEGALGGNSYIAGKKLTLADICLGIFVHRWHQYPIERPSLPRLKAYYERLGERPGCRKHVLGPVT